MGTASVHYRTQEDHGLWLPRSCAVFVETLWLSTKNQAGKRNGTGSSVRVSVQNRSEVMGEGGLVQPFFGRFFSRIGTTIVDWSPRMLSPWLQRKNTRSVLELFDIVRPSLRISPTSKGKRIVLDLFPGMRCFHKASISNPYLFYCRPMALDYWVYC